MHSFAKPVPGSQSEFRCGGCPENQLVVIPPHGLGCPPSRCGGWPGNQRVVLLYISLQNQFLGSAAQKISEMFCFEPKHVRLLAWSAISPPCRCGGCPENQRVVLLCICLQHQFPGVRWLHVFCIHLLLSISLTMDLDPLRTNAVAALNISEWVCFLFVCKSSSWEAASPFP